jgi:prophage regulatory protein
MSSRPEDSPAIVTEATHPANKLLRIEGVLERVPVSPSQLYVMIGKRNFPRPVHLGGQASFWVESEVDDWIQVQIAAERKAA